MGAKPPLDLCNLLMSGGFQAPTGAEPGPSWYTIIGPPPPLLSILYMTTHFSANLLLFIFLLFRVRLGLDTFWAERCG